MLVVRPSDHEGLSRLRLAGAWLTIDPQAISACLNISIQGNLTMNIGSKDLDALRETASKR